MNSTVLVAVISGAVALAVAALSYAFNKRRDREAEWRKLKLEHYKEFVAAISGVVGQRSTEQSHIRYADAVNSMVLVAPPKGASGTVRISRRDSYQQPDKIGAAA